MPARLGVAALPFVAVPAPIMRARLGVAALLFLAVPAPIMTIPIVPIRFMPTLVPTRIMPFTLHYDGMRTGCPGGHMPTVQRA